MKLLHISDLHIGRRIGEFNLLEDQRYILNQILDIADTEKPDGVLIAGDVYDKSMPSGEAVELLDDFLTGLALRGIRVFLISGNHDSPERLNFGSRIMTGAGIHIAGVFDGHLQKETLEDEYGPVHIYLMPYLKPALVRPFFEAEIITYDDAVKAVISTAEVDMQSRNVLVAHQFVTSGANQPDRCESESISVGGLDNVDAEAFSPFDYVALGHLHGPQCIGQASVRYAGSPLKYSFSEALQQKSVTVIELREKGTLLFSSIPLVPMRDLREIKGPISALMQTGSDDKEHALDYIHATITDEDEVYDALGRLRTVYPNLMRLDFENSRTSVSSSGVSPEGEAAKKTPIELFAEFFMCQNNNELTAEQQKIMEGVFEKAAGGDLL